VAIPSAEVTFWQVGSEVAKVYTNADGQYSAKIEPGETTIRVKHNAYITREKGPFEIHNPVQPGQFADVALSKPLAANQWRIILSWDKSPADLDSHTYFGYDLLQHVSAQGSRTGNSENAGGLHVSLDRDATNGYGPETTTITGSGKCKKLGSCLIKFKVHRYGSQASNNSTSLRNSGAHVIVYQGDAEVGKYHVPACLKQEAWWTVFTIDATSGENKFYVGDKLRAPYITPLATGESNWATSMDSARWSKVSTPTNSPAVIKGLKMLEATDLHRLDAASYYQVKEASGSLTCQTVSWAGKLGGSEWALCPAGTFLTGLYRSGSKYDNVQGIEQLENAECCALEGAQAEWGECTEETIVAGDGWFRCPELTSGVVGSATAMVGLHASKKPPGTLRSWNGPTLKHATTPGGVYIGGEYIELGFKTDNASELGKMGTDELPPNSFTGRAYGKAGLGYVGDVLGFSKDVQKVLLVDYFAPGVKEEGFYVGFKGSSGKIVQCKNCASSVTDTTNAKSTKASVEALATLSGDGGALQVVQNVTVGYYDKFFKTTVTLKNTGTTPITNVRYMRSVDPDNDKDQGGSYWTQTKLDATVEVDGYALVSAESLTAQQLFKPSYFRGNNSGVGAIVSYFSDDSRAKASFDKIDFPGEWQMIPGPTYPANQYDMAYLPKKQLSPDGVYDPKVYDSPLPRGTSEKTDGFMSICFDVGTLAPGSETTVSFLTSLDARPMTEVRESLKEAAEPVLVIDKMKCCAAKPKPLRDAGTGCKPGR